MKLLTVLTDSLALLRKQPKVFIPKLATTALYSIQNIWAATLALKLTVMPLQEASPEITGLMQESLLLFGFSLAIYFIDLLSYAMYPTIVAAYRKGEEVNLTQALSCALKAWKAIVALGILIQALILAILLTAGAIEYQAFEQSNTLLHLAAVFFILAAAIAVSILLFFAIPLAVLEKRGIIASMKESISMGLTHKNDLFRINVLLMLLAITSMAVGILYEKQGAIAIAAIGIFIAVRLTQALIYAYIGTINPYVYLHVKEK
jgi:hypothetical protein